jgi:NADPH-dependent ferric siderophore reductase
MVAMALFGEVIEVRSLSPAMRRVVLGGPGLAPFAPTPWTDQYVNALFVPPGAPYTAPFDVDQARAGEPVNRPRGRRFTVRAWDPASRTLTIDFVVHGDVGVAGRWAGGAVPGDRLQFTGPNGGYAPDPDADWHLMVGDESALPAIAASLEAMAPGSRVLAVAIVDDADSRLPLPDPGALDLVWVHRRTEPEGGESLLRAVEDLTFPRGRVQVFVHGEAGEVRAIRRHLLAERGLPREGASISPYWRRDHTDERWREIKAEWLAASERDLTAPGPGEPAAPESVGRQRG